MTGNNITPKAPFQLHSYEERWSSEQLQECIELFHLTETQLSHLMELKERIATNSIMGRNAWGNGPFELTRFVLEHTCHANVDTMEQRVKKCVAWRTQHNLDTILETYTPPMPIYQFPAGILQGTDHEDDVVVVVRMGDPLGMLHRFGRDELVQSLFWANEFTIRGPWQLDYYNDNFQQRPKRATAVVDLKGLNRRHYHPSLILLVSQLGHSLQLHYPYLIKKVLIINAPSIFRVVWAIFKPFVFEHLRALMEIASTEEASEALVKAHMDLAVLPEVLFPGQAHGKAVRGIHPNWECLLLPPETPSDWDRPQLVYGNSKRILKGQETALTASMRSSDCTPSENSNQIGKSNESLPINNKSTLVLMKGSWDTSGDVTVVRIP